MYNYVGDLQLYLRYIINCLPSIRKYAADSNYMPAKFNVKSATANMLVITEIYIIIPLQTDYHHSKPWL